MARWATTTIIGSENFSTCRVELVDAGPFKSAVAGSVDWANDGTPHVQAFTRDKRGIQFGLKMVSADMTKLASVFNQFAAAQLSQSGIRVQVIDGIFNIDVWALLDPTVDSFTYNEQSEGFYEGVVLRFISITAH